MTKNVTVQKIESEDEYLQRAIDYRKLLEDEGKLPVDYLKLVDEAKTIVREVAKDYVPKMYKELKKLKLSKENTRLALVADCINIGWKYNSIRRYFPQEIKNTSKIAGALATNKIKQHKKLIQVTNGNTQELTDEDNSNDEKESTITSTNQVTIQEKRLQLNKKYIDQINEKFETSLKANGKGLVDIIFTEKNKSLKIVNIASVL